MHLRKPFPIALPPAAVALLSGLALTGIFFVGIRYLEHRSVELDFVKRAEIRLAAVSHGLDHAVEILRYVNGALDTYGPGDPVQFRNLTQPLLHHHSYIRVIGFRRHLAAEERHAFEERMRRLYPDFHIKELADGKLVSAGSRPSYRVAEYIEPMTGNEAALGLDVLSIPAQAKALAVSASSGQPAASQLFPLAQNLKASDGVVVMMPLYRKARPPSPSREPAALIGDISIAINAGELVRQILQQANLLDKADIHASVYFGNASQERHLIFHEAVPISAVSLLPAWLKWVWYDQPGSISKTLWLADQPWHMEVSTSPAFFAKRHMGSPLVLLGGMLLTLLTVLYTQRMSLRSRDIERLVEQRTSELLENRERFRQLIAMSSDWYWEQDADLRLLSVTGGSDTTERFDLSACLGKKIGEMPYQTTISDDDRERYETAVHARKPYRDIVLGIYGAQNKLLYYNVNADPLFDTDGTFKGYRGTGKDITDQKNMEMQLRESKKLLRQHAAHQDSIREDERKRIAREIHDELGQNLLALRIEAAVLQMRTTSHSRLNARISEAIKQIDSTMRAVKAIINNLRPAVLDLGLRPAIEWQMAQFQKRHKIITELIWRGDDAGLGEQLATALFRILQESLTNIARHAHATETHIKVQIDSSHFRLEISDNGIGIDLGKPKKIGSFGLIGIEERIRALQGQFYIASSPRKGTTITISIPLPSAGQPLIASNTTAATNTMADAPLL